MAKNVSIYIHDHVYSLIAERDTNRSSIINRDLERLYKLYHRALKSIDLTLSEVWLILDALNSSLMTADTAGLLWVNIAESIELDDLDKKWDVDGNQLVEKLKNLSPFENMSIIDASERFWNCKDADRNEETIKKLFII
jgi:hypothetical protein